MALPSLDAVDGIENISTPNLLLIQLDIETCGRHGGVEQTLSQLTPHALLVAVNNKIKPLHVMPLNRDIASKL